MRKKILVAALASALTMPFAASSFAQSAETSGVSVGSVQSPEMTQTRNDILASQLLGKEVRNMQGEELGEIEDVLVNVNSGRVQYAVLESGGFLGVGEKLFAFPLSAFERSQQGEQLVLNVDKQKLENAPGFDKKNWPNYRGETDFFDRVRNFFGAEATQDDTVEGRRSMMRLSRMTGQDVDDVNGRYVGEIEDAVVDLGSGRVSYVIMEYDENNSPNDRMIPLPITAFAAPQRTGGDIILTVDRQHIDSAMDIDPNNWPNLNAEDYQRNMDRYFTLLQEARPTEAERVEAEGVTESSGEVGEVERVERVERVEPVEETSGEIREVEPVGETSGALGEVERVERVERVEDAEEHYIDTGEPRPLTGPTQPRPADPSEIPGPQR